MAGRQRARRRVLPASFAYSGTGNAAMGGSSDPTGNPSGYDQMVLTGRGGYTKLDDGRLIKGSYATLNSEPYRNNSLGIATPFANAQGQRVGTIGPQGWKSTLSGARAGGAPVEFGSGPQPIRRQPFQNEGRQPMPGGPGGGRTMPHTQIGQLGKGTGKPNAGNRNQPGSGPRPIGPPTQAPGFAGAPGAFPQAPPTVPNFLPMTPGYEADYRSANDQLAGAEGAYAASGTMIPAQLGLQRARLDTDMGVATDRLKEQLAERGVYTPGASPAGGGIGQALYGRQVATPFGRAFQDLASSGAEAYQGRALDYGGANLGFNQAMYDALLQRANDAFSAMPLSLPIGGYELPQMAGPQFSTPGKTRPRKNRRGRGKGRK